MAHLWIRDDTDQWAVYLLTGTCSFDDLSADTLLRQENIGAVSLIPVSDANTEEWHVVAGLRVGVRVNGLPLLTRIRHLRDQDQIAVAQRWAYFSTEERAHCAPFPGADRKLFCARCRQELFAGVEAVKCPQCGVWHHQSEELPCWTYAAHCGLCSQLTDLNAGYRWQPGERL